MSRRFFYSGDRNIEHGGYFYDLSTWKWGYVGALRVTPCSDAGGPDNLFWIEELTVNLREGEELRSILQTCSIEELPKGAARRHAIVDAHVQYGAYDFNPIDTVQIGPGDPYYSGFDRFEPTRKVRAGTSLRNLARKLAKEYA